MPDTQSLLKQKVFRGLDDNVQVVKSILVKNGDLIWRPFTLQEGHGLAGAVFYFDGLSSNQLLDETILRPLMIETLLAHEPNAQVRPLHDAEKLRSEHLTTPEVKLVDTFEKAIDGLLSGESLIFIDGYEQAFLAGTKGWESRSPGDTATEIVVRGPRDGFTENIRTNTSLIRRRVKDPMLRLESVQAGERTQTVINVMYIEGVAKDSLVEEVMRRLKSLKIDAVLESGYIQELIQDAPLSPFPTIRFTERPDGAAAAILEGRVVILTDTTPFALIVPTYFWDSLTASDDYYTHYYMGTFSRIIRFIAFVISLTLPSIYVMLVSFHQEMIPTQLALSVAAGRESVPFPVLVEVLSMETAFELMREAGIRMPRPVGQAVSIVGSLIIGQAAVQAGLVSPIMVIIVALTGISSFAIPSYGTSFAVRLLRFPVLLAAGTLGLLGFVCVLFVITVHALSLRSFGEPYMAPVVPFRPSDQKDSLVRSPWWSMQRRPWMAQDPQRQGAAQKPSPDGGNGGGSGGEQNQPKRRQPRRTRKVLQ